MIPAPADLALLADAAKVGPVVRRFASEVVPAAEDAARVHRHGLMRARGLTDREVTVLEGIAEGWTNAQIGRPLFVEEETIKANVRNLLRKMGADNRVHAVTLGFRWGWLA